MKRTTPFQCFHKQPVPDAAAANRWQEHVQGGAEGAWAPAPLPKVPFCQGNFNFNFYFLLNTLLWRPAQSNY